MLAKRITICEARMKHKNGNWVWVLDRGKTFEWDEDGKPVRMAGTHLDITERKRAEEALRQAHEELERRVRERTAELREMVNLMTGREIRMAELKEMIRQLHTQLEDAGLEPVADDPLAAWMEE